MTLNDLELILKVTKTLDDMTQKSLNFKRMIRQKQGWQVFINKCLNCLLPAKRDSERIGSLLSTNEYPLLRANTTWFKKSFLPRTLSN